MKQKTQPVAIFGMSLFCAVITWASTPVPFTAYEFTPTSTGVVATFEFDSTDDLIYSIERTDNLVSNVWNAVVTNLPGTGNPIVHIDVAPLTPASFFYKASSIDAAPENILLNDDFEIGTPTADKSSTFDPVPWQRYVLSVNNSWLTDDSFDPVVGTDNQAIEFSWGATYVYQDFTALENRTYLFSADALNPGDANNGLAAQLQVEWYNASLAQIGSTWIIDTADNDTDPSNTWFELSGSAVAPAGAVSGRILLICDKTDSPQGYFIDNAYVGLVPLPPPPPPSIESTAWVYDGSGTPTQSASAQYAGLYAVAGNDIEIRTIDESLVDTITAAEMESLLPGAEINGLAFTSSGRQLFITANGTSSDSVLAYNKGTGQLRNFTTGLDVATSAEKLGLAHFKGELFTGSTSGEIRRYQAQLGDLTGTYLGSIHVGAPVQSMAVDIPGEMIYVASPDHLYSFNPSNSALTQIAVVSNLVEVTMGRTYGANGHGGLVLLQDHGNERILSLVSTDTLRTGGAVTPEPYFEMETTISAISATACGRILATGNTAYMLSETTDTRMDFMEWVADEFQQNVLLAKTLCWQDGGLTGMVQNSASQLGRSRRQMASPDSAYWVVNQLLMSDEINHDTEAQSMVREIVKRYATLRVNTDGHWYHWYNSTDGLSSDSTTSVYSTMKGVHMAIRAKAYYPNDSEIVAAANTIIGNLRNQRDYVREFGKLASPADDLGPIIAPFTPAPYQEIHQFSELMAATEAMCENAYLDYWRTRDNHTFDYTLPNEPIIKTAMAGFWRMYDQSTIGFCRNDAQWQEEFQNFGALFSGWTDDHAPSHLTAFSAGSIPDINDPDPSTAYTYSSDKYTSHPGTVNSFGTVIGFGLHGDTAPVVGAYFAYRDGQRQSMQGSANYTSPDLLTRVSYDYPTWALLDISPTDHQYGGYALGEILSPGSISRTISLETYIDPHWTPEGNGDRTVEFSRTVRRHVLATTDGTNWDSLGFQYAPFTVPASSPYTHFAVVGAEGELLDPASETALDQDYNVAADFDGTLYIVRAVSTHASPLRVRWYNGATFISEQTGSQTVEAVKPAAATILRTDLSGGTFEQISVVLDGAEDHFSNQGFELGNLSSWGSWAGTGMGRAVVSDTRLEGTKVCELTATIGAPNGAQSGVIHEYDISGDPVDTHYVLEFDVLTENLQGSSIRSLLEVLNTNTVIRTDFFDTYEHAHSQTQLSAGSRKRDTDHQTLKFTIKLRRDDGTVVNANERVLIDNLRLLKMRP